MTDERDARLPDELEPGEPLGHPPPRPPRVSAATDAVKWIRWGTKVLLRGASGVLKVARSRQLKPYLRPWMEFDRAEDVPWELLAGQGVRAVLFDLENTLVPSGGPFTPEAREVVRAVRGAGMFAAVVSNASAGWVPAALDAEGIPYVAPAGKPGPDGFLRACRMIGVVPHRAVYVGDQMITDVLGAQRAGLRAILVKPRYPHEFFSARVQRVLAKGVLKLTGTG